MTIERLQERTRITFYGNLHGSDQDVCAITFDEMFDSGSSREGKLNAHRYPCTVP